MTDQVTGLEAESLIAELVGLTQVCGGVLPDDAATLWRELALWRNIAPGATPAADARNVLESFGEPWDEDYLEEDGTPSLAALEAVHASARRSFENSQVVDRGASDVDEDEDEEFAPQERDISAQTSLWNILTLVNHIKERRLILNPEWQRSFVWKPRKQKALIESLLLGLPIPSFLIYRDRETGKMSVIDGRQRLETISRFTHPKEARGENKTRFRTFGPTQEGWRPGQLLNSAAGKFYDTLPDKFRTQFDTCNLQVAVLDVPLDHLYQIFKRYNTGSVALNAAEIRNAVFQTSALHTMMFRLGGEHRELSKYKDKEEERTCEDLRAIMKNKQSRYGAYDFIGRVLAFRHESTGSVAKAIFNFMTREHRADEARIDILRREFIDAFNATTRWYEYPLTEPRADGMFHAFLATIQMVSTDHLLARVKSGVITDDAVTRFIRANWGEYTQKVLSEKQNSTNFWRFQKDWLDFLEKGIGLVSAPV